MRVHLHMHLQVQSPLQLVLQLRSPLPLPFAASRYLNSYTRPSYCKHYGSAEGYARVGAHIQLLHIIIHSPFTLYKAPSHYTEPLSHCRRLLALYQAPSHYTKRLSHSTKLLFKPVVADILYNKKRYLSANLLKSAHVPKSNL